MDTNGIRKYKNEEYTEFICSDKNPMENKDFIEDLYRHFNKKPNDLFNNNKKAYNALCTYTGEGSRHINLRLHSNEEFIKNNQDKYSEVYLEIKRFLKEYYTTSPIITYRVISERYIENAINKRDFFKGLVSTGCVLSSLKESNGAEFAKDIERSIIRIFVPKGINCIMLPKEVAVWPEDVEILISDGYDDYEIEETNEICELPYYNARIYNLYLKVPN